MWGKQVKTFGGWLDKLPIHRIQSKPLLRCISRVLPKAQRYSTQSLFEFLQRQSKKTPNKPEMKQWWKASTAVLQCSSFVMGEWQIVLPKTGATSSSTLLSWALQSALRASCGYSQQLGEVSPSSVHPLQKKLLCHGTDRKSRATENATCCTK